MGVTHDLSSNSLKKVDICRESTDESYIRALFVNNKSKKCHGTSNRHRSFIKIKNVFIKLRKTENLSLAIFNSAL